MGEFTNVTSDTKDPSSLIIATAIVIFIVCLAFIPIFLTMKETIEDNHIFRKLLRFAPIEIVEGDNILRDYVFSHELPAKKSIFSSCYNFLCSLCFFCKKNKKSSKKTTGDAASSVFDEELSILDTCSKAVVICTQTGIINRMNPKSMQLFGFPTQTGLKFFIFLKILVFLMIF